VTWEALQSSGLKLVPEFDPALRDVKPSSPYRAAELESHSIKRKLFDVSEIQSCALGKRQLFDRLHNLAITNRPAGNPGVSDRVDHMRGGFPVRPRGNATQCFHRF